MEKQYDEMNFEDLFNQVVGELNEEKDAEEIQGINLLNTTTISRVAMVKSQKAKSFLNYINKVNSGQGRYSVPTTELILIGVCGCACGDTAG